MKKTVYNHNSHRKNNKTSKLIDLYIRNNQKQALLIHTHHQTNLENITNTITTRFHVPPEDQILFHNGHQLRNPNTNT